MLYFNTMDNILTINFITPTEIMEAIAQRFKALRLHHNWTRVSLAERSGVNENTIKRFENSGQITMANLLRLAVAMDAQQEFLDLFPVPRVQSIAELEKQSHQRKRASTKKSK